LLLTPYFLLLTSYSLLLTPYFLLLASYSLLLNFFIFLLTIVWKSVKIPVCLPAGKRKPPVGAGFSGAPQ